MVDNKKEFFYHADRGIVGTFACQYQDKQDPEKVYVEYYPLNNAGSLKPPKKVRFPKPIPRSCIYVLNGDDSLPGVEPRIVMIWTGEKGSLMNKVMSEKDRRIKSLQDELDRERAKSATAELDADSANSGVSKKMEKLQDISKKGSPSPAGFGAPPLVGRGRGENADFDNYESFEQ